MFDDDDDNNNNNNNAVVVVVVFIVIIFSCKHPITPVSPDHILATPPRLTPFSSHTATAG